MEDSVAQEALEQQIEVAVVGVRKMEVTQQVAPVLLLFVTQALLAWVQVVL
jgi:hypothetical protein